jgi:hypothetical protein
LRRALHLITIHIFLPHLHMQYPARRAGIQASLYAIKLRITLACKNAAFLHIPFRLLNDEWVSLNILGPSGFIISVQLVPVRSGPQYRESGFLLEAYTSRFSTLFKFSELRSKSFTMSESGSLVTMAPPLVTKPVFLVSKS